MTIDRILGVCALGIITVGCMFMNMEQRKRHEELYSLMADHFVYEEVAGLKERALQWYEATHSKDASKIFAHTIQSGGSGIDLYLSQVKHDELSPLIKEAIDKGNLRRGNLTLERQ